MEASSQERPEHPALRAQSVSKRFGTVDALRQASLTLRGGQVHALVGENGAGKTTLARVLAGETLPDSGQLYLGTDAVSVSSSRAAAALGVGIVHQRVELADALRAWENVVLGAEPCLAGFVRSASARREVAELARRHNFTTPLEAPAGNLSAAHRNEVEILRVLFRGARYILLDEPTSVLGPNEIAPFLDTVRSLADAGAAVLFITHRLDEVFRVADRVTVLRRGEVTTTCAASETDADELPHFMFDERVARQLHAERPPAGDVVLSLAGLCTRAPVALKNLWLDVCAGEIVAVAGVAGNGQTELVETITGLVPVTTGAITLRARRVDHLPARARLMRGLAVVPEDPLRDAFARDLTIAENLVLGNLCAADRTTREHFTSWGLISPAFSRQWADRVMSEFDIVPPDATASPAALSGGNLRKLALARAIVARPAVLVVHNPTAGLDARAVAATRRLLSEAGGVGMGVLVISQDLDEVLAIGDRVVVLSRGRVRLNRTRGEVTREQVAAMMTGGRGEAAT